PARGITIKVDEGREKPGPEIPEPSEIKACLKTLDALYAKDLERSLQAAAAGRNVPPRRPWVRYRAIIYTLIFTGMRISELRGLPRDSKHVDLRHGWIKIDQRADESGVIGPCKTAAAYRTIEIPDILITVLR